MSARRLGTAHKHTSASRNSHFAGPQARADPPFRTATRDSGFRTLEDWNMRPLWTVIGRVDPRRFSTFAKGQGADSENVALFPRETMDDLPFPEGFGSLTVSATRLGGRLGFGTRRKGVRTAGVMQDGSTPSKYRRVNGLVVAGAGEAGEEIVHRHNFSSGSGGRRKMKKKKGRGRGGGGARMKTKRAGVRKNRNKKGRRKTATALRISSGSSGSSSGRKSGTSRRWSTSMPPPPSTLRPPG